MELFKQMQNQYQPSSRTQGKPKPDDAAQEGSPANVESDDKNSNSTADMDSGAARTSPSQPANKRGILRIILGAVAPALLGFVLFGITMDLDPYQRTLTSGWNILQAGAVISAVDQKVTATDYQLEFPTQSGEQVEMVVWDYAAEDGDWVQILVNGIPLEDPFMILHQPRRVQVPVGSQVTVVGVRDGGGGITYAVNFPAIRTSIRNGTPIGNGNEYFLNVKSQ